MSNDFRSTASCENLHRRAGLLRRLRLFFDERDFIEVQTPVISQCIVVDRHLDPIVVSLHQSALTSTDQQSSGTSEQSLRFLQTSPELGMKRLLASGLKRIYQVGPVFRAGELGSLHNPEFTMAEWYRVDDGYEQGIQITEDLLTHLLETPTATRMRYATIFEKLLDIDPLEADTRQLANFAVQQKLVESTEWTNDRDDWLNLIFSHLIQPKLGHDRPAVVTHFPVSQAALAVVSPDDPRTAERFEVFYQGVELANGYHELTDANVLRSRDLLANQQRVSDGKIKLPETSYLLDAMDAGLPTSSGCALGFDRVVMLACGAQSIREVLCFPWDRA